MALCHNLLIAACFIILAAFSHWTCRAGLNCSVPAVNESLYSPCIGRDCLIPNELSVSPWPIVFGEKKKWPFFSRTKIRKMLCVESLLRSICIVTSQISDHVDIEAKLIEDNEMEVRGHISLLQRFRCSEEMISDRFVVQEFARTKQWKRVSWLPPNFSELCLISFRRRGSCNYGKKGRRVRFHEFYKGTLT